MKLLPCPFCGGEPEEDGGMFFEFYGHERQDYSIACKKCRAEVRCDVGEHEGADAPCSCHHDTRKICAEKWNRRAAMLQGADEKPELTVWYGSMPESNGKANWTAILHRKGEGRCMDGFTIDRSEYPGRVLYAADRVRYLIGEKSERPSILDYDADAHSGYVKTGNSPVIADCSCRTCRPITLTDMRFVVCPGCGNKRCPHANDHRNACTGSNEPGQVGSAYPATPQQEVK